MQKKGMSDVVFEVKLLYLLDNAFNYIHGTKGTEDGRMLKEREL